MSPAEGLRLRNITNSAPFSEQLFRKMPPKRKAALRPSIIVSDTDLSSSESHTSFSDVPMYKPLKRCKINQGLTKKTPPSQLIDSFAGRKELGPSYGDGPP
jgi:hypothetical protein